jgi:hypothetical protein
MMFLASTGHTCGGQIRDPPQARTELTKRDRSLPQPCCMLEQGSRPSPVAHSSLAWVRVLSVLLNICVRPTQILDLGHGAS